MIKPQFLTTKAAKKNQRRSYMVNIFLYQTAGPDLL